MKYCHKVQYYETDQMGITHHSNYIRWMEEARIDFLDQIGWSYQKLEDAGILSPVTAVSGKYKKPTTFGEQIFITVTVQEFRGVRLILHYAMENEANEPVYEGTSEHCFINTEGKMIQLKKEYPEFHQLFTKLANNEE